MRGNRWTLLAVCGLSLGIVGLPGCDQESEHTRSIREASDRLASLLPETSKVPEVIFVDGRSPDDPNAFGYRQQALERVVQSLSTATTQGNAAEKASASVLSSNAHLALAKGDYLAAQEGVRSAISLSLQARSALAAWIRLQGSIAALSQYDPAPEIRAIDTQVAALGKEVEAQRARQQQVESRVASLRAAAGAEADRARAERQREQALREQARHLSETEGLILIEQATAHRRSADAFDVKAADLEAQADRIAPELGEIALDLSRTNNQRASLERARQDVNSRANRYEEQISRARADATSAQAEVEEAVRAIGTLAEGDLRQAFENTQARLDRAIAAASAGAREAKAAGNLALGAARQTLGELEWSRAQVAALHAALMRDLAAVQPPLANRAAYAQEQQRLDAAARDALERATAAFTEAHDAFQASGGRGEASIALERLGQRLRDIVKVTSDGRVDLLVPEGEAPPAGDAGSDAPLDAGDDRAQIAAAIDGLAAAALHGDETSLRDAFHATTPGARGLLDGMVSMLIATSRLDRACESQFGQKLTDYMASQAGDAGLPMASGLGAGDVAGADMTIEVNGDRASAFAPGAEAEAQPYIKVDGTWKADLDATLAENPMAGMMAGMLAPVGQAMAQVAGRVEAGAFSTIEEVAAALMQSMMPPGGPGGG